MTLLLPGVADLPAQNGDQFIYGMVTTKSGDQYRGFIRWGNEELTWHDIFNSTKTDAQMKESQTGKGFSWSDLAWDFNSIWKDKRYSSNRSFACQFGDIAFLHNRGRDKVDVELKNGAIIKVRGGSNDVGARLRMIDFELGVIKFDWDRIKHVEFFQAPAGENPDYGSLLYGQVKSRRGGIFTGYIKWDTDERVSKDILDGNSKNGEQKIPFGNILSITKDDNGSVVSFPSGRDIFLKGSNDVADGNRGIVVFQDGIGNVEIPWKHFEEITFQEPQGGLGYRDYPDPKPIEGTVLLFNGNTHEGQIIFDMDELWSLEMLDGNDDYVEYQIPFRYIKSIRPKNKAYSLVELHNGDEFLLGDSQDVSRSNDGVLIMNKSNGKPISIEWDDIDQIDFK